MGNRHRFLADGGALVAALLLVLAVVLAVVLAAILMPGAGLAQTPMGDMPMPGTAKVTGQAPAVIAGAVTPTPPALQAPMAAGGTMSQGTMSQGTMSRGMMMGRGMMGRGMMGQDMMGRGVMMGQGGMSGAAGMSGMATSTPAAVPDASAADVEAADAVQGQQLTLANGCARCHALDAGQMSVGPNWHGLAATAAGRVAGQKAEDYLYTSIVQPNTYVVPGYRPNVMVQTYGQTVASGELADIVKYLLTLHG